MANNRMYLRCRTCGKGFFLGKGFGGPYYTSNCFYQKDSRITAPEEPDAFLDAFNEFIDEHCWCTNELSKEDIEYLEPKFVKPTHEIDHENNFEIAYESYREEDEE